MNNQEKIALILGDVALPLIGFLFWNWGFYFIALYFIADQLTKQIFLFFRFKNINLSASFKAILLSKSYILFFVQVLIIILINYQITSDFNPVKGLVSFLTYKDMGVQQGVILIPLLIFAEWMKLKADRKLNLSDEIKQKKINDNLQLSQIHLAAIGFILGIINFLVLPESIIVYIFLLGIGLPLFLSISKNKRPV